MSGTDGDGVLLAGLEVAVPLEIDALRWTGEEHRAWLAHSGRLNPAIAEGGDDLLYGGARCAESFTRLARALALLAYQPGGVMFGPLAWCATHPTQRWGKADGVCPACLSTEARPTAEPGRRSCADVAVTRDLL